MRKAGDKSLCIRIGGNDMTIDEAIKMYKKITNTDANCPRYCMRPCDECVQECEQITEWLEELKVYRDNERVYDQQYDIGYDKGYDKGFYEGYNKAIDDVEREFLKCDKIHYNLQDILNVFNKVKAGGTSGTDNQ